MSARYDCEVNGMSVWNSVWESIIKFKECFERQVQDAYFHSICNKVSRNLGNINYLNLNRFMFKLSLILKPRLHDAS